ncbi:unnamed protein product [Blepharisma stoltei]|uniref:Protein kinase domain-containing protein n=1 Tax=Blepharisma stoltei TaxID=1481888 RepID=A0AAU9KKX0_9CILI|nr:unnamed protein product [Blepharisma stoltei]
MGCCCSKRSDPTCEEDQVAISTKSLKSEIEFKIIAPETSNIGRKSKLSPRTPKRHYKAWSSSPSPPKSPFLSKNMKLSSTKTPDTNSSGDLFNEGFSHAFLKILIKDNFSVVRKLHSEKNGKTFLAKDRKTGLKRVIREVEKASIPIEAQEKYIMEIQKFQCLDHPNVIKLHEVYESEENWSLIYEFFPGNNLLHKIHNGNIGSSMACNIIKDILCGLHYFHKNRIFHLGLNLENIYIDSRDVKTNCKIIGLNYPWEPEDQIKINGVTCYMAPEILSRVYDNPASDIWSVGVILYLMIQGKPPFRGQSKNDLLNSYKRGLDFEENNWILAAGELKDLLRKMLEFDFNKRITIDIALNHPWIKNNQSLLTMPDGTQLKADFSN